VRTIWTGRCSSRGVALLSLGLALVLLAVGAGTLVALHDSGVGACAGWLLVAAAVVVAVSGWVLSSLEARLTEDELTLAFGPVGWPRRVVDLTQVVDVSAVLVEPAEWGGRGYRWIPRAKTSGVVLRKGPGIALEFRDGRRFVVTVDDAVAGAQLTSAALHGAGRA